MVDKERPQQYENLTMQLVPDNQDGGLLPRRRRRRYISKYTHRQGWEMDGGKVAEVKLADYSQWLQKLLSGRLTTTATEND